MDSQRCNIYVTDLYIIDVKRISNFAHARVVWKASKALIKMLAVVTQLDQNCRMLGTKKAIQDSKELQHEKHDNITNI